MKKALIIDDTKNIRIMLQKCLELEGYNVTAATNGLEALNILQEESFNLIFLDIKIVFFSFHRNKSESLLGTYKRSGQSLL